MAVTRFQVPLFIRNTNPARFIPGFISGLATADDSTNIVSDDVGGVKKQGEGNLYFAGVKQNGEDNLTLGEAFKRGIVPKGSYPTWTPVAAARYKACVEPHIRAYRRAVEKVNINAWSSYNMQTFSYVSTALGGVFLEDILNGFSGDKAIRARWQFTDKTIKSGFSKTRGAFWVAFAFSTTTYYLARTDTLRRDFDAWEAATNSFFEKVNTCRENNPHDGWRTATAEEHEIEKYVLSPPHLQHPNKFIGLPPKGGKRW